MPIGEKLYLWGLNLKPDNKMLEKDYIMRLIRQFFEALEKLKEKRGKENESTLQMETNGMYRSYFHQPQDFFYEAGMDIILAYMQARFSEEECLQRMELLAELLRFEGQMLNEKALELLTFADTHSDTFSFERRRKMEEIKAQLKA